MVLISRKYLHRKSKTARYHLHCPNFFSKFTINWEIFTKFKISEVEISSISRYKSLKILPKMHFQFTSGEQKSLETIMEFHSHKKYSTKSCETVSLSDTV